MGLLDIALPYRRQRSFGAASFALVFVTLVLEIELLVLVGVALVARRFDLFIDLQPAILPAAVLVSLLAALTFAWRARAWTKQRITAVRDWGTGASSYAEHLAQRRRA